MTGFTRHNSQMSLTMSKTSESFKILNITRPGHLHESAFNHLSMDSHVTADGLGQGNVFCERAADVVKRGRKGQPGT